MRIKTEWKKLFFIVAVFAACFYLPVGKERFDSALTESLIQEDISWTEERF